MSFRPKFTRSWWIYHNWSMFIPCSIPHPHCFFIHLDSFWCFCRAWILDSGGTISQIFPLPPCHPSDATWGLRTSNASTLRHELARFLKDNPKLEIAGDTLEDCDPTSLLEQWVVIWGNPQLLNYINIIDGYWLILMDMNIYIYIYMNGASSNQLLYQLLHQLTDSARQWWT